MASLTVTGKSLGSKRKLFSDFSIPIDPDWQGDDGVTLRDLITATVAEQVNAYEKRQADRKFLRALTTKEISAGLAKGKVDSGGFEGKPVKIDLGNATATALQAFTDGLYLVSVDGQDQRDLDGQLFLTEESSVAFIRLTLLAGG